MYMCDDKLLRFPFSRDSKCLLHDKGLEITMLLAQTKPIQGQ